MLLGKCSNLLPPRGQWAKFYKRTCPRRTRKARSFSLRLSRRRWFVCCGNENAPQIKADNRRCFSKFAFICGENNSSLHNQTISGLRGFSVMGVFLSRISRITLTRVEAGQPTPKDCLLPRKMSFLPRNMCFLPRNVPFLPRNVCFLPGNMPFLPRNICFLPRNMSFLPRNMCFLPGNMPFLPRTLCLLPAFQAGSWVKVFALFRQACQPFWLVRVRGEGCFCNLALLCSGFFTNIKNPQPDCRGFLFCCRGFTSAWQSAHRPGLAFAERSSWNLGEKGCIAWEACGHGQCF